MNKPPDQTLGRYQIVSLIARGGMAEVYKAFQPSLNRYVAIKVLHPHLADEPGFVSRFEREAASVARLRHPNIVQVIDFDCQDERYFMVMEFIEGDTLKSKLEERAEPYSPQETAHVISGVASALDYAHNRGVVHRDIKPGNILFTSEGQVVLADFGIAHIIGTTLYTQSASALGTPAYMSPEQARGEPGDTRSDIYSLGVVLYQMLLGCLPFEADTPFGLIQQHIEAPLPSPRQLDSNLPVTVEAVIKRALTKSPDQRYQHAGEMALALLEAVGLSAEQVIGVAAFPNVFETPEKVEIARKSLPICPYRGLFSFREQDAPYFFGREIFSDQLIDAAESRSLVAVVGPSGSGKSSVVLAGLLPLLRQGAGLRGAQGRAWLLTDCRPGADPFYSLATALLPLLERQLTETDHLLETRKLSTSLQNGELPLTDVVKRILKKSLEHGRLLLVIDQFEELYTLCPDTETRHVFVEALLQALQPDANLTLVITLRADFLGQALSLRPFADALQDTTLMLGPMTKWELVQAIENPARKQGVTFEAGLVERILDEVGDEPGNLPLLEFALTQLWEEQESGQLTHAAYETIGRVQGALARYADQVYTSLNETQRNQARHIFTQMVRPGEGTQDTRRLAERQELGDEYWSLVQELANSRLVVTGRESASGHETVEVVHEALIQGWGQLREWMAEDRLFRTWQERIRAALRQWEMSNRDEGALLRGAPLIEAQRWLTERESSLSGFEKEFILQSIEQRKRKQTEIDRRRRITFIALTAGMIIALALALITNNQRIIAQDESYARATAQAEAIQEREKAEEQARIASARELTLASQTSLEVDPELSILLGLQSASIWKDLNQSLPNDLQVLLHQAIQSSRARLTWSAGEEDILDVSFIQPGDMPRVITADRQDGSVSIWDPEANQRLMTIPDSVMASPLSPDGRTLAVSGQDNTVRLVDTTIGQVRGSLESPSTRISGAAFSLDGEYLLTKSQSEYTVWEAVFGGKIMGIPTPAGDRLYAVFSWDAKYLAVVGPEFTIYIYEIASGQQTLTIKADFDVIAMTFSPDGTEIAGAGRETYAKVWDTTSGNTVLTLDLLQATNPTHGGQYETITYSPDGTRLIVGGVIWDARSGKVLFPILGHTGGISSQSFNSDASQLITASYDKTVRTWDLTPEHEVLTRSQPPGGFYYGVAFSPDSKILVTTSLDKSPKVWDIASAKEIATLIGHTDAVNAVDFNEDGTLLATGSADRTVIVWDTQSWQARRTLTEHGEDKPGIIPVIRGVVDIDLSPKCASINESSICPLAGVGMDGQLVVWDALSGRVLYTYQDQQGGLKSVAFSPDGNMLAIGSTGELTNPIGSIIIFDANTGQMLNRLPGEANSGWVWDLAFNPDGNQLAAISFRGDGNIWDVVTGDVQFKLKGLGSGQSVTYSPNGTVLATGGDGNIKLWEAGAGSPLFSLPGHKALIHALTFSSDGRYLASASFDGSARVFVIPSEDLLSLARSRLTRDLTVEECQQYLHMDTCPPLSDW